MTQYAQNTTVSVDRSMAEIKTILNRYGAEQFGFTEDANRGLAMIHFFAHGRHVRFLLQLPQQMDIAFVQTPTGKDRSADAAFKEWEKACRQRWRALTLCIKAKLEAVESGIAEFENEFMANIVLPGGGTVGELMKPQIENAYITSKDPIGIAGLLPAPIDDAK